MKTGIFCRGSLVAACIAVFLAAACAPKPYVLVRYRTPAASGDLAGKSVFVRFLDGRSDPRFLGPSAVSRFPHFTGNFFLVLEPGGGQEVNLGSRSLASLFESALKKRLEDAGAGIAATEQAADAGLEIVLNDFRLDLAGGSWILDLEYTLNISRQGTFLGAQTTTAVGERQRLIGTREAEKLVGEVFTDAFNRMDLSGFFRKAGF